MFASPKNCIICGHNPVSLNLNGLDMKKCLKCNLLWRSEFSLPEHHYEEKRVDLSASKLNARMENCISRVNVFDKYVDLNNICDLGTGEGMFLKVLKDFDYKGVFGIEPSEQVDDFSKKNSLDIRQGTIASLPSILKTRRVNGISMFHLIEHVDDPVMTLNLIHGSLPTGGYLIIETPNSNSYVLKRTGFKHELVYPEHLFLFDMNNLKELLLKSGFNVIASGKRDFNPNNLNLRDILFKLGITKFRSQGDKMNVGQVFKPASDSQGSKKSRAVKIIKPILSFFVRLLGRQDYLWIIAKK